VPFQDQGVGPRATVVVEQSLLLTRERLDAELIFVDRAPQLLQTIGQQWFHGPPCVSGRLDVGQF